MSIEARPLEISDIVLLRPKRHGDARGYFCETYSKRTLAGVGIDLDFVQDNVSLSKIPGTVRGLHFQSPPYAQAKLIQVLQGRILDVAVDIRKDSATFGEYAAAELSAQDGEQILIPTGFAHGFCTLEPDTMVNYKVSDFYAPSHEHCILWNDPDINIDWPVRPCAAQLSGKDAQAPRLREIESPF